MTKKKESNIELIVKLRKQLHNIPEKSMHEVKTKQTLIHFIETHTQSLEIVDMNQWFYVVKKGKCHDHPALHTMEYEFDDEIIGPVIGIYKEISQS